MNLTKITLSSFAILTIISPLYALALPLVPCGGDGNPCTVACFYVMIDRIINFLLRDIAFPLAATALMAAGIMMVLGGSEKSISLGKDILKYAIIGLLLSFGAWVIVSGILGNLLQEGGTYWPWNKFPSGACGGV